jgi:ribosomal protein L40E
MMNDSVKICSNCDTENSANANYCTNCGQKIGDKLNLRVLFYNTIGNYFSFDARFFKSIIPLLFKPGFIAKEFVNGRRLRYLHPGQMYLFVSVIFFFVFSYTVRDGRESIEENTKSLIDYREEHFKALDTILNIDSLKVEAFKEIKKNKILTEGETRSLDSIIEAANKTEGNSNPFNFDFDDNKIDSLLAIKASDEEIYKAMGMQEGDNFLRKKIFKQGLKLYKTMGFGQVYQYFIDSIPLAMFILMPVFAFLLKLFYYKGGNYSHHLVFSFYFFCFLFLVFSIVLGVNRIVEIPDWIDSLIVLSTFLYLWRAIIRFYERHWFFALLKGGIISFIYLILIIPISAVILFFIAFLFY